MELISAWSLCSKWMSTWEGRLRSSSISTPKMSNKEGTQPSTDGDAKFELQLMQALQNPLVTAQFRDAIAPLITPLKDALCQNTAQVASLRAQLAERDEIIDNLQNHVRGLEIKIDDLEQQRRQGSILVFGLPEDSPGTLDEKPLTLFNQNTSTDWKERKKIKVTRRYFIKWKFFLLRSVANFCKSARCP